MWNFAFAVLIPPIVLACWSRIRTAALVTTTLLTGIAVFLVSLVIISDPSHIGAYATFFLAFGPAVAVPVATITAASFARARSLRILGVAFAGLLGWALGIVAMFVPEASAHAPVPFDPWWRVVEISGPTIYCSCGAVLATVRERSASSRWS